jgi:hypothetical protein
MSVGRDVIESAFLEASRAGDTKRQDAVLGVASMLSRELIRQGIEPKAGLFARDKSRPGWLIADLRTADPNSSVRTITHTSVESNRLGLASDGILVCEQRIIEPDGTYGEVLPSQVELTPERIIKLDAQAKGQQVEGRPYPQGLADRYNSRLLTGRLSTFASEQLPLAQQRVAGFILQHYTTTNGNPVFLYPDAA